MRLLFLQEIIRLIDVGARSRRGSAVACLLGLRVRIPPGHGCLSLVNVVCCRVVSVMGCSLVLRSPTDCVCVCARARARACVCNNIVYTCNK